MKQYIYSFISFVILLGMASCSTDNKLDPVPTAGEVNYSITPSAANPNIYEFENSTPESIAHWDFGNGSSGKGDELTTEYALQGEYDVTLTVFKSGGQVTITEKITIAKTDYDLLDRDDFNFLTGGIDSLEGKTWKFQRYAVGHQGIGPADSSNPDWWGAQPLDKDGLGSYDDELVFNIYGFKFDLENNGDNQVLGGAEGLFEANYGGTITGGNNGDGYKMDATLNTEDWSWNIIKKDGKNFLTFANGAFPSWYVGESNEFEIITLTKDHLYLKTIGFDGNAWFYGFAPKEIADEPIPKAVEENDIFDNFRGSSSDNLSFGTQGPIEFESSFEFDDQSGNPASLVGMYARTDSTEDAGGFIQNINAVLPFAMDLSTRNKFSIKVFVPSDNDFSSGLEQKIEMKLQNSLLGAKASEDEVVKEVIISAQDQWVNIEFDFSDVSDRIDFDKIFIQIGGEGHSEAGTFYISDFKLK